MIPAGALRPWRSAALRSRLDYSSGRAGRNAVDATVAPHCPAPRARGATLQAKCPARSTGFDRAGRSPPPQRLGSDATCDIAERRQGWRGMCGTRDGPCESGWGSTQRGPPLAAPDRRFAAAHRARSSQTRTRRNHDRLRSARDLFSRHAVKWRKPATTAMRTNPQVGVGAPPTSTAAISGAAGSRRCAASGGWCESRRGVGNGGSRAGRLRQPTRRRPWRRGRGTRSGRGVQP